MGWGGKRAGAGRKPKVTKFGGQIAAAEERIADKLPLLIDKAFELAEGVECSKETGRGGTVVYSKPPEMAAITFLIERIAGKAPQEVILTGEEGGPIQIEATHRQAAEAELEQWTSEMIAKQSSSPSAPPTSATSSTPTG